MKRPTTRTARGRLTARNATRRPESGRVRPNVLTSPALALDRAGLHDLERRAGDPLELVEVLVVPAPVGRAGDVPVRAVVGHDHPVRLERLGDDARLAAQAADVVGGLH